MTKAEISEELRKIICLMCDAMEGHNPWDSHKALEEFRTKPIFTADEVKWWLDSLADIRNNI